MKVNEVKKKFQSIDFKDVPAGAFFMTGGAIYKKFQGIVQNGRRPNNETPTEPLALFIGAPFPTGYSTEKTGEAYRFSENSRCQLISIEELNFSYS